MLLTPDTKLTARDIEHFLLAASFGRVGQEHHYASKWAKSATLTTLTDEATGHICGLAATYMNRPTHDYAYLTYIAVLPANRGGARQTPVTQCVTASCRTSLQASAPRGGKDKRRGPAPLPQLRLHRHGRDRHILLYGAHTAITTREESARAVSRPASTCRLPQPCRAVCRYLRKEADNA